MINGSFGSDIFSVKIHKAGGLPPDGSYIKRSDYDECVYIEDFESKSKEKAVKALIASSEYINQGTSEKLERLIIEKLAKGETITKEWIDSTKASIIPQLFPIKDYKLAKQITDSLNNIHYDIVLNKKQY